MPKSRIFNVANMSVYDIRQNKILAKTFEFTVLSHMHPDGHHREKTCLRGFQQSQIQTSLLSYRE